MNLNVPSQALSLYKEIVERWADHAGWCDIHLSEFCSCGLTDRIKELRKQCKGIQEINPQVKLEP